MENVEGKSVDGSEAGGVAPFGGQIAYLEVGSKTWMAEAGIHQWGHNFGLKHNWEDDFTDNKYPTNYMSYSNFRTGSFSVQQLQDIVGSAVSTLNQGNPTQKSMNSSNNWIWHTSTNNQPYDFNVKKGDIIPIIIANP